MSLVHRTAFEDSDKVAVCLPFHSSLLEFHPNGSFPLLKDPLKEKAASIVGMFVLRPADHVAFTGPLLDENGKPTDTIYNPDLHWVYNIEGFTGGWLIANFNGIDAYRLGMQYGVSDAVICSSNIVCTDGVDTDTMPGYTWQPYNPLNWPSVRSIDCNMEEKVAATRLMWQERGYLSKRKYPAQIIFTWTGLHYDGSPDFLQGSLFTKKHPDGTEIEVYIMTSELGASRIRERCGLYNLQDRIEKMLIVVPPATASETGELSSSIDLNLVPKILYEQYDMKIVNHDGGHKVLAEFCRAGVLCQMNLTMCRKFTVREVLQAMPHISQEKKDVTFIDFQDKLYHFFSYPGEPNEESAGSEQDDDAKELRNKRIIRGVPPTMPIVSVIDDPADEVSIFVFDTHQGVDFYRK